uniref:Uncharacterized protein n=1 Tax=Steinernema glaseri TaxID=37863 RepID=A0A1I7Y9G8_9BILA
MRFADTSPANSSISETIYASKKCYYVQWVYVAAEQESVHGCFTPVCMSAPRTRCSITLMFNVVEAYEAACVLLLEPNSSDPMISP